MSRLLPLFCSVSKVLSVPCFLWLVSSIQCATCVFQPALCSLWFGLIKAVPFQPVTIDVTSDDDRRIGISLRETNPLRMSLNEPMHIGMRWLHPAAADHSVSISRQQVQRIFSLRSRAVSLFCYWPLLRVNLKKVPVTLPRSRVPPGGSRGGATSDSSRTGVTVTVRNSPPRNQPPRAPPSTGT